MNYSLSNKDGIQILKLTNIDLEYENRKILETIDDHILDGETQYVIDMQELSFINSTGLNFLISVLTRSRNAGGETVLMNISEQANQLLVITKLKSVITSCESFEAAKAVFESQADLT